ncbi:hypothetical protein KBD81_04380 [Candidatus Woesebacteria bacterium]|nr:hypothetical protein [Candidatus Woesebacteria bacterium]
MSKSTVLLEHSILHTLTYFELFRYPPTFKELVTYSSIGCSDSEVQACVKNLVSRKRVIVQGERVAMKAQTHSVFDRNSQISSSRIREFEALSPWFTWIPMVSYVGISGSLSMHDADFEADIDIFLITAPNAVWITRSILLTITRTASLFGNNTARMLCWNIMIEESDLSLPPQKRNEYTAHEILQLHTVFQRHHMYSRLLHANSWITQIFPNVQVNYTNNHDSYRLLKQPKIICWLDNLLRFFQRLWLIKKGYLIHEHGRQVWFIQDDYEKKIPLKLKKV